MTLAVWWGFVNFIFGLLGCWVAWQIFVIRVRIRDINRKLRHITKDPPPAADMTSLQGSLTDLWAILPEETQYKGEGK